MKLHVKIFLDLLLRKIFITGVFLLFTNVSLFAQDYLSDINSAFKIGDVELLTKYFDNSIDLTFSDKTNTYSKKQAAVIIQKFFNKTNPKDYKSLQRGASNANNTKFHIGSLYTTNGVYKVYMFFIVKKGQYFLKELRFEK